MQQAMLEINGVLTHVITAGRWVEEGLASTGHKDIVLVIPGNPGIPGYYEGFVESMKLRLPTETPVWVVGHAGHVLPSKTTHSSLPPDHSDWHRYNLSGQLEHKKSFIEQHIPRDARLHLVGHSIGCWFIIQLLKNEELADRVVKCYMLFPTIERMRESESGKFLSNIILRMATVIIFLSWLFSLLPTILQKILVRIFGGLFGVTNKSIKPTLQLLDPIVLKRVLRLAQDEMHSVRRLDHDMIARYIDKLWLYYGSTDGWTPRFYYDELKTRYPKISAQMCERGFRHAFVLSHDKQMGNMIGDVVNETIQQL